MLLTLHLMNRFCQYTLVLELVTLCQHVQGVVNVLIDLLGIAHLFQETAKNADTSHPQHFEGETGVGSTLALTMTCCLG